MSTRSTDAAAFTGGCSYAPSSPHPRALSRPARPTSTGATAMRRGSQLSWAPAHAPPRCSSWAISTRPSSRWESGTSSARSASSTRSERPTPPRRVSRSGSPCGSSAHSRRGAWTSSCSPPARTPAAAWSRAVSSSTSRAARRAGCSGHRTTTGCCPRWRFSGARVMGRQGAVGRERRLERAIRPDGVLPPRRLSEPRKVSVTTKRTTGGGLLGRSPGAGRRQERAECRRARTPPPALLLPAPALRRRELPHVAHAALEDGRDLRIRLAALLGLVSQHRRLHEPPHHALERVVRALELGRVVDRTGRARLAAEAAVHALRHVDVEAGQDAAAGGLVLHGGDPDAVDRAGALAGEAGGADLEVDLEHAAVAERERVLHAHARGEPVRVLHGVGLSDQVREGDRHAVGDRQRRVLDVAEVDAEPHQPSPGMRSVARML